MNPDLTRQPFTPGDRVMFQDTTLKPVPRPRYGTVEEYFPGDPAIIHVNMDKGSRMQTLASNVTLMPQGVHHCPVCGDPATVRFYVHRQTIHVCHRHQSLSDHELIILAAQRRGPARPIDLNPRPGDVLELPKIGPAFVAYVSPAGAVGAKLPNGTQVNLTRDAVLKTSTYPRP